ncbi:uncharacterized protein F4822DRAFT_423783 [Hypoxylon trugodes]|uniref:uncharacterized protein n=1 Tax=Hypoxylon trugodes TaxID=326681 RepID=UPI002198E22B|nr:uncharacterized protein F4822DRAFT_423783 [Hypoxylon trugodes]KAI1393314.1 hypothetical protein F4822DRAFT_423783 [Hypoxylon trugodes]
MVETRVAKSRKEAKAMATRRRDTKAKSRLMRKCVLDKYNLRVPGASGQEDFDLSETESSQEKTVVRRRSTKGKDWDLPAYSKKRPGPPGVSLRTMLRTAEECYKLAIHDFDKMSLYDHMCYIQKVVKGPDEDVAQSLVTKALISVAQHQKHIAEENIVACIAKLSITNNLPQDLRPNFKTCTNCFEKFRVTPATCNCKKLEKICLHTSCQYHPGELRSHNDQIAASDGETKLGADFLKKGNVTLREFELWIQTCYWDCCDGKLLKLEADAGRRSQRRKRVPLNPWEIRHPNDGILGCVTEDKHVPI